MIHLRLTVNGFPRECLAEPHETLLDVLRDRFGLVGTKKGCEQGSCGACTVHLDGVPVLSCLTPAARCQGQSVRTIEGVAEGEKLHPLQRQLVEKGAIQCGYCTPGMVMAALPFLDSHPHPSEGEIREALSGNLCRCTGYARIVEAVKAAAEEMHP